MSNFDTYLVDYLILYEDIPKLNRKNVPSSVLTVYNFIATKLRI